MLERFARRRAGRNHKANKELALSRLRASTTRYEPGRPIGTRQRMWLDVLAYTGLRRGDAAVLGRQHVRNGIARIKTEKTLPILPVLQRTLDAGPCGDLTSIVGANGKPLTKERFGNLLCEAYQYCRRPRFCLWNSEIAATGQQRTGRRLPNSKPSLVGAAVAWYRTTRRRPVACGLPAGQCTSWRTKIERP